MQRLIRHRRSLSRCISCNIYDPRRIAIQFVRCCHELVPETQVCSQARRYAPVILSIKTVRVINVINAATIEFRD